MWRWHELLPVATPEQIVSLGEGDTPLLELPRLAAHLNMTGLLAKDESLNPTGSFKARGLAAAVSKAHELGIEKVIIPTAGNAGGALAAYAARCGMRAAVYMPEDTPPANMREVEITGAELVLVKGLISDAAAQAGVRARDEGWFDVSTFKEPYRLEGKKVMGFRDCPGIELADSGCDYLSHRRWDWPGGNLESFSRVNRAGMAARSGSDPHGSRTGGGLCAGCKSLYAWGRNL